MAQVDETGTVPGQPEHEPIRSNRIQRSGLRPFRASRPTLIVDSQGCSRIGPESISSVRVGWKAVGLNALPAEWVLPFFVVDCTILQPRNSGALDQQVSQCIRDLGFENSPIIVRSSGTAETMGNRLSDHPKPASDYHLKTGQRE